MMAGVVQKLRSARRRHPPQPYTPSRSTECVDVHRVNYVMNPQKALQKKISSANRENDIELMDKDGTAVMTFSAAAYEIFKQSAIAFYNNHTDLQSTQTRKVSSTDLVEGDMVTELSLSIKYKSGGRQLYRVNFFPTTSRVDVNGRMYHKFLQEDLITICNVFQQKCNITPMNNQISELCQAALHVIQKNANPKPRKIVNTQKENNKKQLTLPKPVLLDVEKSLKLSLDHEERLLEEDVAEEESGMLCSVCMMDISTSESIECGTCESWNHSICENLTQKQMQQYSEDVNAYYECRSCRILDKSEISSISLVDATTQHTVNGKESKQILMDLPPITSDIVTIVDTSDIQDTSTGSPEQQAITSTVYIAKSPVTKNSNTDKQVSNLSVNELPRLALNSNQADNGKQPGKGKKARKLDSSGQELADCKARIVMLEVANRDYLNTIQLLNEKLDRLTTEKSAERKNDVNELHRRDHIFNNQNAESSYQMKLMQAEILHRMEILELKTQHKVETGNLILQQEIQKLQSNVHKQDQYDRTMVNQSKEVPLAATVPSIHTMPIPPQIPTMLMHRPAAYPAPLAHTSRLNTMYPPSQIPQLRAQNIHTGYTPPNPMMHQNGSGHQGMTKQTFMPPSYGSYLSMQNNPDIQLRNLQMIDRQIQQPQLQTQNFVGVPLHHIPSRCDSPLPIFMQDQVKQTCPMKMTTNNQSLREQQPVQCINLISKDQSEQGIDLVPVDQERQRCNNEQPANDTAGDQIQENDGTAAEISHPQTPNTDDSDSVRRTDDNQRKYGIQTHRYDNSIQSRSITLEDNTMHRISSNQQCNPHNAHPQSHSGNNNHFDNTDTIDTSSQGGHEENSRKKSFLCQGQAATTTWKH